MTDPYKVEHRPDQTWAWHVTNGGVLATACFDWEEDAIEYAEWMNERAAKAAEAKPGEEFETVQGWQRDA